MKLKGKVPFTHKKTYSEDFGKEKGIIEVTS